ncbi:hypothetical protein SLEP1_g6632 [Rubroshorea leprosula]|uniref:Ribosomal protein L6 n=1 Tax=Rubroshorea leprosula TaxID=152421 RepID=A0AAV5I5N4_9ROSI|nr:hypothetical protein SLEP1_g6632 [Rubroshorea leprosula]
MSGHVEIDRNSIVIKGDPKEVFDCSVSLALRSSFRFYVSEGTKSRTGKNEGSDVLKG